MIITTRYAAYSPRRCESSSFFSVSNIGSRLFNLNLPTEMAANQMALLSLFFPAIFRRVICILDCMEVAYLRIHSCQTDVHTTAGLSPAAGTGFRSASQTRQTKTEDRLKGARHDSYYRSVMIYYTFRYQITRRSGETWLYWNLAATSSPLLAHPLSQ